MDRNDYNDKKGITVDLSNDTIDFIPNTIHLYSKKVKVISEGDIG
jgi:hypothetical protein